MFCPSRVRRPQRILMTLLMVLLVAEASTFAFAHGGSGKGHSGGRHFSGMHSWRHHSHGGAGGGVIVGAPAFFYFPPLPYFPPVVEAPTAPPVYIEQGNDPSAPDRSSGYPAGYWYYCADAQAYYPDVKECAGAWQLVAPQAAQGQ